MLLQRVCAGVGLVALLGLGLYADYRMADSLCLHAIFLVGAFFSFREFWALCRASGHQTFSNWGTLSGCAMIALHYGMVHWVARQPGATERIEIQLAARNLMDAALVAAVLGAFVLTVRRQKFPASLGGLGVTCLGLIYIWFLPTFVLRLRVLGQDGLLGGEDWNGFGTRMVIATLAVAKGCDVWAYLVGRCVGRHKAFPELSPGKTIEGVVAGLSGSALLALFLNWAPIGILPDKMFGFTGALVFGLSVGFAGMLGDLSESLLKRSAGVKDASHLVPGFGGMLDVMDSLVLAGPVAYFLVLVIVTQCRLPL